MIHQYVDRINSTDHLVLSVPGVKMWNSMFIMKHLDHDPIELGYSRHTRCSNLTRVGSMRPVRSLLSSTTPAYTG